MRITVLNPPPTISSIDHSSISADDTIKLTGNNFGTTGTLKLGTISATSINSWSNTSISAVVPTGISSSVLQILNSNGASNYIPYTIISSTGIPTVIQTIPNLEMLSSDTLFAANLLYTFSDPNHGILTYSATVSDPSISVMPDSLTLGKLYLIASKDAFGPVTIAIKATDPTSKSISTSFVVTVSSSVVAPPSSPILLSPLSGSTGLQIPCKLTWNKVRNASCYQLQVSEKSDFSSLIYMDTLIVDTIKQISYLNYSMTYYWRVLAKDLGGIGNYSSPWNFTTSPAPTITITSPQNGEQWQVGSTKTISWTSTNLNGNIYIKLSIDGGGTFPIILASNSINDGTETIEVPDLPSVDCKIRIQAINDLSRYGTSTGSFGITKQSLPPWAQGRIGRNHTIKIPYNINPNISGKEIAIGDYIGVFYDSSTTKACAGYQAWNGIGSIYISAMGDDPGTSTKDGFADLEKFKWKIFKTSGNAILNALATYAPIDGFITQTDSFVVNGYSQLASLSSTDSLPQIKTGLIAYYPFNGNVKDSSGNGYNGINNGATFISDRFGSSGKALYFPSGGSGYGSSYIQLQNTDSVVLNNTFTISLWIKLESNGVIFDRDVIGTYTTDWNIYAESGKVIFSFGTYDHVSISRSITDSKWHNLIFIRDKASGYLSIYLDGVLDIQSPNHTNDLTDTPTIYLGNMDTPNGYNSGFVGFLDDVRIYNRTLSTNEIDTLYHGGGWTQPVSGQDYMISTSLWEGQKWSRNVNQGAWFPVIDTVAHFGIDNYSWGQVRTKATMPLGTTVQIDAWIYLNSGGTNGNLAYFGFGDQWVFYSGNFYGLKFYNGEVHLIEMESFQTETDKGKIGTCTAGERITFTISLNANGTISASGNNFSGSFTPTTPITSALRCMMTDANNTPNNGFLVSSVTTTAQNVNGLVAYYPFNGNANDESGNGNNGTNTDATLTANRFGNEGKAYSFNGTSSYIRSGLSSNLKINGSATLAAWVEGTNPTDIIVSLEDGTNQYLQITMRAGSIPGGNIYTNGSWKAITSSEPIVDNNWHFIVLTLFPDSAVLYTDSRRVANLSSVGVLTSPAQLLVTIGRNPSTFFSGKLDDIRIYNRAINATEVLALYNESGWNPINSGLVAYYPFNGNVNDVSGNSHNGTITGATLTTDRFGSPNSAYSLNGTNNYISAPYSSSLSLTNALTLVAWVKLTNSANDQKIIGKATYDPSWGYVLGVINSKLYPEIWDVNGTDFKATEGFIPSNMWTQICVTWTTGGRVIGYINGSEVFNKAASTASISTTTSDLIFGTVPWGPGSGVQSVAGSIDDIRIYNRALNASEIDTLYHENGYDPLTSVRENDNEKIPKTYSLSQNYPNPYNPSTTIQYGLPARSSVRLIIYNILGQVVKELINTEQQAGIQSVVWNANVSSGLYFYRLEATSLDNPSKRFVETKKMLLLR